jgi:hypothetical protein
LRIKHRAAEIAPADAELDGDIALLVLAIDEGCAGDQAHLGDVAQRNLDDAIAAGILRVDGDAADGVEAHRGVL